MTEFPNGTQTDKLCTNDEAAGMLGIHPKSLVRARVYGGPLSELPYVKIGRNVRYRLSDITRFLQANLYNTTNQHRYG
jgi:hypothetical protein